MRLLITLGPGYEPIDQARRLTNFSTGRLGAVLANAFFGAGWEVHCLRAESSSYRGPIHTPEVESFSTNDDLAEKLERIGRYRKIDAIFHAAALCDYRVSRVIGASGQTLNSPKISTRDGRLTLELEPATKVLPLLRQWFPESIIVGWKYELTGGRDDALAKAWRQLEDCNTDACVVNGAAYGPGFGLCFPNRDLTECANEASLIDQLSDWLSGVEKGSRFGREVLA